MKLYNFLINFDPNFLLKFVKNPVRCPNKLIRYSLIGFPNVRIFTTNNYNPINPNIPHQVEFKPILNFGENNRCTLDYLYMKISPADNTTTKNTIIPAHFSYHFKRLPFMSDDTNNINYTGMRDNIILFNMTNYYFIPKQSKASLKLSLLYFYFEISIEKDKHNQYLKIKKDIDSSLNAYKINAINILNGDINNEERTVTG